MLFFQILIGVNIVFLNRKIVYLLEIKDETRSRVVLILVKDNMIDGFVVFGSWLSNFSRVVHFTEVDFHLILVVAVRLNRLDGQIVFLTNWLRGFLEFSHVNNVINCELNKMSNTK